MKLSDAIFKMNTGERFEMCPGEYIEKVSERTFTWNGGEELSFTQFWTYKNNKGEIIRAEPEVLTVEEIREIFKQRIFPVLIESNTEKKVVDLICLSDKNGQNKEWKRLKPFRDSITAHLNLSQDSDSDTDFRDSWDAITCAFKNLTPPWELEK